MLSSLWRSAAAESSFCGPSEWVSWMDGRRRAISRMNGESAAGWSLSTGSTMGWDESCFFRLASSIAMRISSSDKPECSIASASLIFLASSGLKCVSSRMCKKLMSIFASALTMSYCSASVWIVISLAETHAPSLSRIQRVVRNFSCSADS